MKVAAVIVLAVIAALFATAVRMSGIKAWKVAALLAVLEAGAAARITLLNPS